MPVFQPQRLPGTREFVCLMAMLTAVEAVSIDMMLPALDEMGAALNAVGNAPQLIISTIFIGVAVGQFVSGPVSDIIGRRRALFAFLAIYLAGTVVCLFAGTMPQMLTGRVLQGFGAAGPYVVAFAMIRDRYAGRDMARINSFVLTTFMIMPVVAPLIGQNIIVFAGWRWLFAAFIGFTVCLVLWFAMRQPETLPAAGRLAPNPVALLRAGRAVLAHRALVVGTVVEGLLLGGFIGYLSGSQPLFLDLYGVDALFPVFFAGLALFIAGAGILNAGLVMRLGMRRLIHLSFATSIAAAALFVAFLLLADGPAPFWLTFGWLAVTVFCCGIGFSNVAALALEPVEAAAGIGASIFGGFATLLAAPIGMAIGLAYDQTPLPMAAGFLITSAISWLLLRFSLPRPVPQAA